MKYVEFTDPAFAIVVEGKADPVALKGIEVAPSSFVRYATAAKASAASANRERDFLRARIVEQATFLDGDGGRYAITHEELTRLPIQYTSALKAALDSDVGEPELLNKGDGINTPMHVRLGTPIVGADWEISELEFRAQTYGDIEDVLAQNINVDQTVALIANCATPVGVKGLLALPSWAVDQITDADGAFIMLKVLPNFTGQGDGL